MQFKVPQNIDLEDKIIGPLTLVQFIYLITGGIIIYISFSVFSPIVFWPIAIIVGLLSLTLAFIKIQDQPFSRFLASMALFFVRPQKRVWNKEIALEEIPYKKASQIKKEDMKVPQKAVEKSELEKLSYILDTRGKAGEQKNIKTEVQKK
jgi:hypothetical protein